jgi:hypothetical protein
MRRMVALLVIFVFSTGFISFSTAFGALLEDFESGVPFRWYNTGAPGMGISQFALGNYSLMVNNSEDIFYVTFYDPSPTIVGGSDLRFKLYYSPSEINSGMSANCFMLYDDESSESRVVTPSSWIFDQWNEMSCNGGGDGRLVSVIIYFTNTKGMIYIDDMGFREQPSGGDGGLTGLAIFPNTLMAFLFPAFLVGIIGIILLEIFSKRQ